MGKDDSGEMEEGDIGRSTRSAGGSRKDIGRSKGDAGKLEEDLREIKGNAVESEGGTEGSGEDAGRIQEMYKEMQEDLLMEVQGDP
jgi:hypothetical protein